MTSLIVFNVHTRVALKSALSNIQRRPLGGSDDIEAGLAFEYTTTKKNHSIDARTINYAKQKKQVLRVSLTGSDRGFNVEGFG